MCELIHHLGSRIFPEMAVASAVVKLGSLVKEVAICWTKNCWIEDFCALSTNPDLTKSSVTVGQALRIVCVGEETGLDPLVPSLCFEPTDISPLWLPWLCSPSYVVTSIVGSSKLLCTCIILGHHHTLQKFQIKH